MIKFVGPKEIKNISEDQYVINVTSTSNTWSKYLSPFYVGPVNLYNGMVSKNFENAYQYSKVYKEHVGAIGLPTEEWFKWAQDGWKNLKGVRYPMGKDAIPEYLYWDGKKYGYIDGRKQVYVPLYASTVKKTDAFKRLEREYNNKEFNITLFDFDVYDKGEKSYKELMEDPTKKFGHGFILGMLLEGFFD